MFGVDVGIIPCGMRASTTVSFGTQQWSTISADLQIWPHKCGGNTMVRTLYQHPQHIMFGNHLVYVWSQCGNHSMWDESLNHCIMVSFDTQQWSMISADLQIRSRKCGGNSMMGAPYPHPQHIMFVNHLVYVWSGCGNHSMWDESLNHCMMVSFDTQQWSMISADFSNPVPQVWW